MQKKVMGALAAAAVATLAASGAAMAAQPASKAKPATTVVYQGVQVAIDPVTGRLRAPNAVERRALNKALVANQARSIRPLDEAQARSTFKRNRRTGMMSMQVPETQVSHLAAHRTADGAIKVGHETAGTDASSSTEVTP